MSRASPDLIDGEFRQAATGNSARRVYQVTELAGAAGQRLANATQAPGIPRVGDRHPYDATLKVATVSARPASDPSMALVEVAYNTGTTSSTVEGGAEVSIQSDLITEETVYDVNGERITTAYSYPLKISGTTGTGFTPTTPGVNTTITNTQVHRIEVQRPTFAVVYTRRERQAPLAVARTYAGTVNASPFLGEPADAWLCNVQGDQESEGLHRVRYTFTLNKKGWQAIVNHTLNGIIPEAISSVNGTRRAQVYERSNFNALRLPSI